MQLANYLNHLKYIPLDLLINICDQYSVLYTLQYTLSHSVLYSIRVVFMQRFRLFLAQCKY